MIAKSKLVLHGEIFLATLEKNQLQVAEFIYCYTLQCRAVTCNGFKAIHAVVAESRTELYFVQFLEAQKCCEKSYREGMLYATTYLQLVSQGDCITSFKEDCTVQHYL